MSVVVDEHPDTRGLRSWAPEGRGLQDASFARRHAFVRTLLLLHVPTLGILGISRGYAPAGVLAGLVPLALAWVAGGIGAPAVRAAAVSTGLAIASLLLVLWSGGSTEAHFHVFVVIAFVSVYQNWVAFGSVVLTTLGVEALIAAKDSTLIFDHAAAQRSPWVWWGVDAGFVLAECVAMMIFWRSTEQESQRATRMATEMTMAELQRTREQADQRQASADLLTNLARRNQSLLNRQLARIDQLEKNEDDPEVLAQLFTLDHLATRMRRNAESLLVLSGEEPPRRFGAPVPLSEVTRGAIAEVEDYTRADVALAADVLVDGHAVSDLVHLLAELIENAATFSPPTSRVVVSGVLQHDSSYVITIDDGGIGMSDAELAQANATLRESGSATEMSGQLGFRVVARLASRHGVSVGLTRAAGATTLGLRATVHLPNQLVSPLPSAAALAPVAEAPEPVAAPVVVPVVPAQPDGSDLLTDTPSWSESDLITQEPPVVPVPAFVVPAQPTAPAPVAVTAAPAAPADPTVTPSGLTRRVPNASLNPNLVTPAPEAPVSEPVEVDPDRTRSTLDAFYGGLSRGAAEEQP